MSVNKKRRIKMSLSGNREFEARAEKCMDKIRQGVHTKRVLSNSADDFNLEKACNDFKKLVDAGQMKKKIKNT